MVSTICYFCITWCGSVWSPPITFNMQVTTFSRKQKTSVTSHDIIFIYSARTKYRISHKTQTKRIKLANEVLEGLEIKKKKNGTYRLSTHLLHLLV